MPYSQSNKRYITSEPSESEIWFEFCRRQIEDSLGNQQPMLAQSIANDWASGICSNLGLSDIQHWKFFKRALVEQWFGKPENKKFSPGWSAKEALEYALSFSGRSVRFSLFPKDIACHAISFRLPEEKREEWHKIIHQADNSIAMEMFPEASNEDTICFRRYSTAFGETIIYEAGKGQAMFVFEQERGQHPVVASTQRENEIVYTWVLPDKNSRKIAKEIETKLKKLIQIHDYSLYHKCFGLCRKLGIEQLSIEGYFDPTKPEKLLIVDLDLPFDFVFMKSESY